MKRFLLQIAVFMAIVAIVDVSIGKIFSYLERNAKGGYTYRDRYICDLLETDILVSGSSRCVRHYNPQILTDSLGGACYNSGQMGNGIILSYGRLRMINERRKPKVIVYDLHPSFDLLIGEDNHRYLTWLKSHYDRDGIAEIFESIDKTEKYKMQSKMYRYNSRWVELTMDYLHKSTDAGNNGFGPLKGEMDPKKIKEVSKKESIKRYDFDPVKVEYINRMINESAGSKLIFVVSPIWYGMDSLKFQPVKELCKSKGIPFYDFSNSPKYVHQDIYFKDGVHMNAKGADEFSRDIVEIFRKEI